MTIYLAMTTYLTKNDRKESSLPLSPQITFTAQRNPYHTEKPFQPEPPLSTRAIFVIMGYLCHPERSEGALPFSQKPLPIGEYEKTGLGLSRRRPVCTFCIKYRAYSLIKSTPRVFFPQCEVTTHPAVVSRISSKRKSSST